MTLYDLIHLPEWAFLALTAVGLWASVVTNGLEHGLFYASSFPPLRRPAWYWDVEAATWRVKIHFVDTLQEIGNYLLFILTGVDLIFALGASMIVRPFFQAAINLGSRLPAIDLDEKRTWDLPIPRIGVVYVPKLFIRQYRLLALPIGIALMLCHGWIWGILPILGAWAKMIIVLIASWAFGAPLT